MIGKWQVMYRSGLDVEEADFETLEEAAATAFAIAADYKVPVWVLLIPAPGIPAAFEKAGLRPTETSSPLELNEIFG